MKNIGILLTFIIVSSVSYGQTSSESMDTKKYFYCELHCIFQKARSGGNYKVEVDFGQEQTKLFQDTKSRDEEVEKISNFSSKIDALNYLSEKGWEFVESQIIIMPNSMQGFHFFDLLRKLKN
jgi:hypothetical protein